MKATSSWFLDDSQYCHKNVFVDRAVVLTFMKKRMLNGTLVSGSRLVVNG